MSPMRDHAYRNSVQTVRSKPTLGGRKKKSERYLLCAITRTENLFKRSAVSRRSAVDRKKQNMSPVWGTRLSMLDCHVLKGFGIYMIGILDRRY